MYARRPFKTFSAEESEVWEIMFARQFPRLQQRACQIYLEGHHHLDLTQEIIPDFADLNERLQRMVGWELLSTDVQYSGGQDWFEHLVRKEFLITEYIREKETIDYTPLPDIFHDTFGHLPLMADKRYADMVHRFSQVIMNYSKEERRGLGSIWWYTIEFGLIREGGELKALGAGLMSSYEELEAAFDGRINLLPFDPATIAPIAPSPHHLHEQLWILESFEQLEEFVEEQLGVLQKG